jgi:predicted MFS family arabinose efflux permease
MTNLLLASFETEKYTFFMKDSSSTQTPQNENLQTFIVLAFGAAVCIATVHFTQPFLPILAEAFQVTKSQVSWIPTLTQIGYAFGIFFLVPLGDVYPIRKLILFKMICLAAALTAAAFAPSFGFLLVTAFMSGIFASSVQDFVPIAAHLAPDAKRGQLVGFVLSGMLIGSMLSRSISGVLTVLIGWRATIGTFAGLVALMILVGIRLIPEMKPALNTKVSAIYLSIFQLCKKRPQVLWIAVRHGLVGLCYSAFWVSLSFLLSDAPFGYSSAQIGYLALPAVFGAILGSWFGKKADRNGPRMNTLFAASIVMIAAVSMFFRHDNVILLAVYGVCVVLGYQVSLVTSQYLIHAIDPAARSRLNAIIITLQFVFLSIGSFLSGLVYRSYQGAGVSLLCAGAAGLSLVMALVSKKKANT